MREKDIEKHFNRGVKKLGGLTFKFTSPNVNGVPDRIVVIQGQVYFVELKTDDGILSPIQIRRIEVLQNHGANAVALYGRWGVDMFLEERKRALIL